MTEQSYKEAAEEIIGVPIEDVSLGTALPTPQDDITFQLGHVSLAIPPTFIRVERIGTIKHQAVLRSKGSLKLNKGKTDTRIIAEIIFPNLAAINHHKNGLRALLALFKRVPFVPVYNRYLNLVERIRAVALHDIQVTTVPQFPSSLQVTLVMFKFEWAPYMPWAEDFGKAIDMETLEWYVGRGLAEWQWSPHGMAPLGRYWANDDPLSFYVIDYEMLSKLAKANIPGGPTDLWDSRMQTIERMHRQITADIRRIELAIKYASGPRPQMTEKEAPDDFSFEQELWEDVKRIRVRIDYLPAYEKGKVFTTGLRGGKIEFYYDMKANKLTYNNADLLDWMREEEKRVYQALLEYREKADLDGIKKEWHGRGFDLNASHYTKEPWLIEGKFVVTSVSGGVMNMFSRLPLEGHVDPVYQYLGAQDHRLQLTIHADERATESLSRLFEYCQVTARSYLRLLQAGFIEIRNPLAKLFGIRHVIIEAMVVNSIPGHPGWFQIELALADYDYMQRAREQGVFITKSRREMVIRSVEGQERPGYFAFGVPSSGDDNARYEWMQIEDLMAGLDCYPDLDLPTWEEYARFKYPDKEEIDLEQIPEYNGGKYVDPDFYFKYDFKSSLAADREAAEGGLPYTARDNLGNEIDNIAFSGANRFSNKLRDLRKSAFAVPDPDDLEAIPIDEVSQDEVHIPEVEEKRQAIISPEEGDITPGERWTEEEAKEDIDMPQSPEDIDRVMALSFHDHFKHSAKGTMLRAFPTFYMFIIDEGFWIRWARIWDNFYGFNAVSSIEIHSSRKTAAQTCTISMSNMEKFIVPGNIEVRLGDRLTKRFRWHDLWFMNPFEVSKGRNEPPRNLYLLPGARLHLRIGYGNNLSEMPIAFNGTITEMDMEETINLVALSDAWELTDELGFAPGTSGVGRHADGKHPRDLLLQLLLRGSRGGFFAQIGMLADNLTGKPLSPVVHFGRPDMRLGFVRIAGEMGQNIYRGTDSDKEAIPNAFAFFDPREDLEDSVKNRQHRRMRMSLDMFGKSIYDAGQMLAACIPNYIFAAHPFDFRSTVFFGKPYWPVAYGYEMKRDERITQEVIDEFLSVEKEILKLRKKDKTFVGKELAKERFARLSQYSPDELIENLDDLWRPVPGYWIREKKKAFSQWHVYTSEEDIMSNEVKVSIRDLHTQVGVVYTEDAGWSGIGHKWKQTDPVWVSADPGIYPQFQRAKIVSSELTARQWRLWGLNLPGAGRVEGWLRNTAVTRTAAFNMACSVLRDSFKDMYQGELVLIGDPTLKPYDTMYIADVHKQIFGTCGVKEVYHHISLETGFVTVASPDVAAAVREENILDLLMLTKIAWAAATLSTAGSLAVRQLQMAISSSPQAAANILTFLRAHGSRIAATAGGRFLISHGGRAVAQLALTRLISTLAVYGTGFLASLLSGPILPMIAALVIVGGSIWYVGHYLSSQMERSFRSRSPIVANFLTSKGKLLAGNIGEFTKLTVVHPDFAKAANLRDFLIDEFGLRVSDQSLPVPSAEEIFGPVAHSAYVDDRVLEAKQISQEIAERIREHGTEADREFLERTYATPGISNVLKNMVRYLALPYQPDGDGMEGIDPRGLLKSVLLDAGVVVTDQDIDHMMRDPMDYLLTKERSFGRGRMDIHERPFVHTSTFGTWGQQGDILLLQFQEGSNRVGQVAIIVDPNKGDVLMIPERPLTDDPSAPTPRLGIYNLFEIFGDHPPQSDIPETRASWVIIKQPRLAAH